MKEQTPRIPSLWVAFLPLCIMVVLLAITVKVFGSDALAGCSQLILLFSTAVCGFIGIVFYQIPWQDFEKAISRNIYNTATALIILLLIGALSSSWMISGVVPTIIYYGVQLIHPTFFLASACLISAIVSVMTGSSWTTIATIGIALMGIGRAQGFDIGWIAGAIISGAYFGDKISPLSDTTVMAASVNGVPLFSHIRYMMITTTPAFIIALIIYLIFGLSFNLTEIESIEIFRSAISDRFVISPWLLIVPFFTIFLIVIKVPSLITIFLSTLVAGIFAYCFQPTILLEIANNGEPNFFNHFKGFMMMFYDRTALTTDNQILKQLIQTHGMSGMLNTIWLILCAMCFGGAMQAGGMLKKITSLFVKAMKNTASLVGSTLFSGLFMNIITADQYISIILTSNMYKEVYKEKGYEVKLLSRSTEDAVTVTSPLIPWSTCGLTQATVLNVSTWIYFPYCFFNILSPLMSFLIAIIGYKIKRIEPQEDEKVEEDNSCC